MATSLLRARITPPVSRGLLRFYSAEAPAPAPPLLQKLKGDLKAAMRAKDAARLSVLRSILSATLNASKTANPITTDAQLVALLRRNVRASQEAAAEFKGAGRQDLVDKEEQQITILDEYMAKSGLEEVGADELRTIVAGVAAAMTAEGAAAGSVKMGDVMKTLMAPGGPLEGKSVDKPQLARTVKQVLGA